MATEGGRSEGILVKESVCVCLQSDVRPVVVCLSVCDQRVMTTELLLCQWNKVWHSL
jgi:hypothetical protein